MVYQKLHMHNFILRLYKPKRITSLGPLVEVFANCNAALCTAYKISIEKSRTMFMRLHLCFFASKVAYQSPPLILLLLY